MNYYCCLQCIDIPSIKTINGDVILIECKKHKEMKIKIIDFIKNCIKKCVFENCNNIPKYLINRQYFICENCFHKINVTQQQYITLQNIYCSKHNNLLTYYCLDCEESKCEKCKKEDINNNHKYLEIKDKKQKLDNFINTAENIIKEIKDILIKMENELILYKILFENSIVTNEIKTNIQNLQIIKNIDDNKEKIFLEKMNEIKNNLECFINFEYFTKNINKDYKNDINDLNKINMGIIKCTTTNNNIKSNVKNSENKIPNNVNMGKKPSNNDNINSFFNNRENEINKAYNINQKSGKSVEGDDEKIFQEPKNKLIQNYSIKLTDISNKNQYIIQKIEDISYKIENKISLEERNNYLISIAHIAREADNYSKELCDILIQKFDKKYKKFSSIIYDKAKTELSSWVNQSLIIEKSDEDIKDLRKFYNIYCQKENQRIQKYLNNSYNSILDEHNFNLEKLFRFLSQLYTEILLFSDKNIYLKYIEKCDFLPNKMKDITDLNGIRLVMFSVLPGLFVKDSNIKDGKILVFCDKNLENSKTKYKIDFQNIKKYELYLKNTITKVNIEYSVHSKKYQIKIKCDPQIPDIENLKFTIKIDNSDTISLDKKTKHTLDEKYKNKIIYATVEVNGENIKSNQIKLENKANK